MSKNCRIMKRKVNSKVRELSEKSVLMEISFSLTQIISNTIHEIEKLAEEIGLADA